MHPYFSIRRRRHDQVAELDARQAVCVRYSERWDAGSDPETLEREGQHRFACDLRDEWNTAYDPTFGLGIEETVSARGTVYLGQALQHAGIALQRRDFAGACGYRAHPTRIAALTMACSFHSS